ncbi:30S ribosomal protein S17e [Haladaptatus sp. NG-SE-30]
MNVESNDVMSIGNRLINQYPNTFTEEFNRNRNAVKNLTDLRSIHLRNRIAGYITRQMQSNS